jgi:predicted AAA+ superfamily ATPase
MTKFPDAVFLDLELESDLRKLDDSELFLTSLPHRIVCLDEIQRKPDLFPLLRVLVDRADLGIRFLILGSASPGLLRQSSESLAGRIHHTELTPFLYQEVLKEAAPASPPAPAPGQVARQKLWLRGGFPRSFLAESDTVSLTWRKSFLRTFLERDLPQLGVGIPAASLSRFWSMLVHYHGQLFNGSQIGSSLGISYVTARRYLDLLERTFMVRILPPLEANLKKRLVKTPKIYLRDTGLLHAWLDLRAFPDLFGHPSFGASWEGWCIEQIAARLSSWRPYFYRTSSGEEIDLVLERGRRRLAFEFKASLAPRTSKGFPATLDALKPEGTWVVCPTEEPGYPLPRGARVVGIGECLSDLAAFAE